MNMQTEKKTLDGVTYEFRQSNFMAARFAAIKLLGVLKGGIKTTIDGKADIDFGAILENLSSQSIREVEEFILNHLEIFPENGQNINGKNDQLVNEHFNQHRKHYYQVLLWGVKFHFADFLPDTLGSLKNINVSKIMEKAADAAQKSIG